MLETAGMDLFAVDTEMERLGHEVRASMDDRYKRATWGLRPEDLSDLQSLTGDLTGERSR